MQTTACSGTAELPDLLVGVDEIDVPSHGVLVGRVGERAVLLARLGDGIVAVQAECPHYGAPLADGCVAGDTIHCPWHHAAFDLRDGSLVRPPALAPLARWPVERRGGTVRVTRREPLPAQRVPASDEAASTTVVVVGAGAAGTAAVLTLRQLGHHGSITLVDPDPDAPYDRPNLSKDYLRGTAPEEWLPLCTARDWDELEVRRIPDAVDAIDAAGRQVALGSEGAVLSWDALLLATGARPRPLPAGGATLEHVCELRSLADCRRILGRAAHARSVVVVGMGFLGLEVAASLRERGLDVAVIGPGREPLERVFGREIGAEIRALHERHGVAFYRECTVRSVEPERVVLSDGTSVPADLVLACVGVTPNVGLAERAGLAVDDGVLVDRFLSASAPGVWAAGDIARFPHPETGRPIRIEHWAVAEAQGRVVANNILGHSLPFEQVPFFWTQQFDTAIAWSGFPDPWDRVVRDGSLERGDAAYRFVGNGRDTAFAAVGRDRESLRWEVERVAVMEGARR